jgi:3-oxoacyl-[acyl-carrier-protein] synthase II
MELKRVVITGIGALTPIGNSASDYFDSLKKGVSGGAPITKFNAEKFKTQFACEVKNFNVEDYIDRREARRLDVFSQYALITAAEAVEDSGMDLEKTDTDRIGVIWGAGIGGLKTLQDECENFFSGDGTPKFNPFFIPKMIADIAAGHISIKYGFRGPNFATVSACASSTNALIDAFNYIRLGKANAILTGGSEAAVTETGVGGFNALHALSQDNHAPQNASRPFDKNRNGFVLGEGSGAMMLEEYEHAIARDAKIYAEVVGGGASGDAHHITAPHPDGLGARNAMKEALRDAGIEPSAIDYINVHGTSTPLGDIAEAKAIQQVFGEHAYKLNISSTKSMTGHLLGAAGVIEALACVLAVTEDVIPPTINHTEVDPELDEKLNFTFNTAQKRSVNYALSNTFGFGGHNATLIIKKYS